MMTTNIHDSCSKILNSIRNSTLNYSCQETPYSMYITVRKSWNKHIQSPDARLRHDQEVAELNTSNQELSDVKADLKTTKKINDELRAKIETAMADINHRHRESEKKLSTKDDENKVLENSLKNCMSENERLKGELKRFQKVLKSKDKEIHKLETFKFNYQEEVKNAKNDVRKQKAENEKLVKQMKMLEKKKGNHQKQINSLENNKNIGSLLSDVSDSVSSHPNCSTSTTEPSVSTLPSNVSRENTPEPKTSSPCPVVSIPKFGTVSAALTISPAITSSSNSSDNLCDHQPQCVIRQPKPPPAEKCSILVHNSSKYHEHFLTSVPARYGPYDDCMAVAYENYGCTDCIWFKKWGELHGYPDLWPLKYIKSGTYADQHSLTEN